MLQLSEVELFLVCFPIATSVATGAKVCFSFMNSMLLCFLPEDEYLRFAVPNSSRLLHLMDFCPQAGQIQYPFQILKPVLEFLVQNHLTQVTSGGRALFRW